MSQTRDGFAISCFGKPALWIFFFVKLTFEMLTVLAQQHTTSKRVVFKSDNVSTHGVLDTQPSDSSSTRWATKARHLLSHFSLVAYGSGKRMVTATRAWSRIKTKNFKRRLLPHHMSQRRDIWCTNSPIISCFNPKFVDLSVPYEAKQRRVNFRRSFGNIPSEFR